MEQLDCFALIQLRVSLIDRLFDLLQEKDQKAEMVLRHIGGKPLDEQVHLLYQFYPNWNEWEELTNSN